MSVLLLPAAAPVAAADGLTMEAKTLLAGHARIGSWMAVSVRLTNDGPPIVGELRLGGPQGTSRYGIAVDLPTQSDKTYVLHAQPPAFGRELEVTLVDGTTTHRDAEGPLLDPRDQPAGRRRHRRAPPGPRVGHRPPTEPEPGRPGRPPAGGRPTCPDRVEAWQAIDRLVWQDVDSSTLSTAQLAAIGNWVAAGGRLIVVGGSTGPGALDAFPDDLLPFRPSATIDVPPASLAGLLGARPVRTRRTCRP